jgi:hypothetical protein
MDAIVPRPLTNGTAASADRFDSARMTAALTGSGLDLASLLPGEWVDGAYASGGPEVRQLTFGFVPLTDCAPLAVAHTQGLFAKHGITSNVSKFTSWTALRDALNNGATQAAQMLFGMPVGAAVGKLGSDQKPLVIPWVLKAVRWSLESRCRRVRTRCGCATGSALAAFIPTKTWRSSPSRRRRWSQT